MHLEVNFLTHWPLGDLNDFTDDKAKLVQVMAWCRQATSHCLNQCCPRSPTPYGVTRPQWVNPINMVFRFGNNKTDIIGWCVEDDFKAQLYISVMLFVLVWRLSYYHLPDHSAAGIDQSTDCTSARHLNILLYKVNGKYDRVIYFFSKINHKIEMRIVIIAFCCVLIWCTQQRLGQYHETIAYLLVCKMYIPTNHFNYNKYYIALNHFTAHLK